MSITKVNVRTVCRCHLYTSGGICILRQGLSAIEDGPETRLSPGGEFKKKKKKKAVELCTESGEDMDKVLDGLPKFDCENAKC